MNRFLLICLGGAAGTGARYLVATGLTRWLGSQLPWGTLAVNLVGSFLLGAIMEAGLGYGMITTDTRVVLATGVMGGFTTYSSFNQETLGYIGRGALLPGLGYPALTFASCLLAGTAGLGLVRWLASP